MRASTGMRVGLGLLLVLVGLGCDVGGDARPQQVEIVARGIEAYTRALETEERDARLAAFHSAERLFAQSADMGAVFPDLYVNLGNAALGAQRLGPAVLAYRRALRLDPDHARALQNLQYARGLLPGWVPRRESAGALDSFFFWHRSLSTRERNWIAAWSFLVAAALWAQGLRKRQTTLRNLAWLPGVVWVALVASLILDPESRARADVVVTAPEVRARAADSAVAPPLFAEPLPSGTEARLLERRPPWARIQLPNARAVWVPLSSLTSVVP